MKVTLFGRLYVLSFLAVTAAIFLTKIVLEHRNYKDDILFFIGTANYLQQKIGTPNNIELDFLGKKYHPINLPDLYASHALGLWLAPGLELDDVCPNCKYFTQSQNAVFFTLDREYGVALFSFEESEYQLLISSTDKIALDTGTVIDGGSENAIIYWLIIIIAVALGFTIYWPLRKLQVQISTLVERQRKFGDGDLSVRAPFGLEKPLSDLASSFDEMAFAIETSVKENQIFSQAIPHELRTPLSRIQLACGLLRKQPLLEQRNALLDDLDSYINDINELIAQIVALSKLKAIDRHHETNTLQDDIILFDFVSERITKLPLQSNKSMNCAIPKDISLKTSSVLLRLIVDNVLKNAMQHASKQIDIAARLTTGGIKLVVADDGQGIREADHEQIFLPFSRLDSSRSRKTGGLGLGLAIARAAAQQLAGEIKVVSSSLEGAVFEVFLPIE